MTDSEGIRSLQMLNNTTVTHPDHIRPQEVKLQESPREATTCVLKGFTQAEAVLVYHQLPRADEIFVIKNKPPDASSPINTREKKTTLVPLPAHEFYKIKLQGNQEQGMKAKLCPIASKVNDAEYFDHKIFVSLDKFSCVSNLAPVLPSKRPCHFQDCEDVNPQCNSGIVSLIRGKEHHIVFDPGAPIEAFPYDIRKKICKEIVVPNATIQRYAFLFVPKSKLLEYEHIKDIYVSTIDLKDVIHYCEKFEHKKIFRHGRFLLDKTYEPNINVVMIDRLSRITYCISYPKTEEVFLVSRPVTENFDILVYNKLLIESKDDIFCTYDLLFRVLVESAQGKQAEEMKAHTPETWLFYLWLMRFTVQVDYHPLKRWRKEQQANKKRCRMIFKPGEGLWIHLRKERFPNERKSKLMPRINGPFRIIKKLNNNAYQLDLQNETDLRSNPFQEGEDDESMASKEEEPIPHGDDNEEQRKQLEPELQGHEDLCISPGPITRSKRDKLQTTLQHLLNTIQGSLACANPTTLVVIQAT
ncbi:hypothetical protein V5N11_030308 [Cardamine amara subsp. amara]|uniref:Tf2-1-like SH3-like domain-containing protein n=1 Tax=Cardamine amara subsp. amara TaxID=228776 RepID=A0ABD1B098_CARAN